MVGSAHHSFETAEEFVCAIRAANVGAAMPASGQFHAELTHVDFDHLWMQRGSESLPRSLHVSLSRKRSPIFFLTDTEQPAIYLNGTEFKPGELLFWGSGNEQYQRTDAAVRWGAMSLAPEKLADNAVTMLGYEISTPGDTLILRPTEAAMARLTALHQVAGLLARSAPDIISHPEVARALEQALVHAMLAALDSGAERATSLRPRSSRSILADLETLIAKNTGKPLYLIDLCVALGAPERTLRRAFHEHFGIGPNRYLWLRRMHLARRALQLASSKDVSVTSIAVTYGFGELGRFSTAYSRLFGEMPSMTLRRSRSSR